MPPIQSEFFEAVIAMKLSYLMLVGVMFPGG
jgi:hypothetical protein